MILDLCLFSILLVIGITSSAKINNNPLLEEEDNHYLTAESEIWFDALSSREELNKVKLKDERFPDIKLRNRLVEMAFDKENFVKYSLITRTQMQNIIDEEYKRRQDGRVKRNLERFPDTKMEISIDEAQNMEKEYLKSIGREYLFGSTLYYLEVKRTKNVDQVNGQMFEYSNPVSFIQKDPQKTYWDHPVTDHRIKKVLHFKRTFNFYLILVENGTLEFYFDGDCYYKNGEFFAEKTQESLISSNETFVHDIDIITALTQENETSGREIFIAYDSFGFPVLSIKFTASYNSFIIENGREEHLNMMFEVNQVNNAPTIKTRRIKNHVPEFDDDLFIDSKSCSIGSLCCKTYKFYPILKKL